MPEELTFVIVGTGNISRTYTSVLEKLEHTRLVGMVSRSRSRPEHVTSSCEIADSLDGIQGEFDAVILATPNGLHHRGALEAAKLGKHVLTEKPLDVTIDAMDEMIEACEQNGVKLGVTYQRRMSPDNRIIYELIRNGELGDIFAADVTVKNYRPADYYNSAKYRGTWEVDGGGPFMMQAIHQIDLYGWFFGMPDQVVSSWGTFTHNIEVEDHGAALLKHGDRMIGTIIASTSAKPGFSGRMEIHSERGTLVLENDRITSWQIEGMDNPSETPEGEIHSGATSASVSDTAGHEKIVRDFAEAVRNDRAPVVDGESAKLATKIVLSIYQNRISRKGSGGAGYVEQAR